MRDAVWPVVWGAQSLPQRVVNSELLLEILVCFDNAWWHAGDERDVVKKVARDLIEVVYAPQCSTSHHTTPHHTTPHHTIP